MTTTAHNPLAAASPRALHCVVVLFLLAAGATLFSCGTESPLLPAASAGSPEPTPWLAPGFSSPANSAQPSTRR